MDFETAIAASTTLTILLGFSATCFLLVVVPAFKSTLKGAKTCTEKLKPEVGPLFRSQGCQSTDKANTTACEALTKDKATGLVYLRTQTACQKLLTKPTGRNPDLGLGNLFQRWLGMCLGALDSRDSCWGHLKAVFRPLFMKHLHGSDDDILQVIRDWQSNLERLYGTMKQTGKPVPIGVIVNELPLNYILHLIFGRSFTRRHKGTFASLRAKADELMLHVFSNYNAKYRFYRYLPTEVNHTLRNFNEEWETVLKTAMEDKGTEEEGLLWQLNQRFHGFSAKNNKLRWSHFSQTLVEIVYANNDVTIPAMEWLLVAYSLHPNIESVGGTIHDYSIEDYIAEVGRIKPVLPRSMPRFPVSHTNVDGLEVQAGTMLVLDFESLGTSPDWKQDDLNHFRPSRFRHLPAEEEVESSDDGSTKSRSKFLNQFGYGGRKCPGYKLANHLFAHVLKTLSENWKIIPKTYLPIEEVPKDSNKPFFSSPVHEVWLLPKSNGLRNSAMSSGSVLKASEQIGMAMLHKSYYGCSTPYSDIEEPAFLAVSVNQASPYLKDPSTVAQVVKYLMRERSAPTAIYICDEPASLNFRAFHKHNYNRAMKEAKKLGDQFDKLFNDAIIKEEEQHQAKSHDGMHCSSTLKVYSWDDDCNRDWKTNEELMQFLKKDDALKKRVETLAMKYILLRTQNSNKTCIASSSSSSSSSTVKKLPLCMEYIYREIPPFVTGIYIRPDNNAAITTRTTTTTPHGSSTGTTAHDGAIHYRQQYYGGNCTHMSAYTTDSDSLHRLIHDIRTDPCFRPIKEEIVRASRTRDCLSVPGFIGITFPSSPNNSNNNKNKN